MMKFFCRLGLGLTLAAIAGVSAFAGSTINPNAPATNSDLISATVRGNFAAAYNDVNNILGMYKGTTAPGSPVVGQDWLDTSVTPAIWKKRYNTGWGQIGTFNLSTGAFNIAAFSVSQSANTVFAGPTSGAAAAPTFRALVSADLPLPTLTTFGAVQAKAAASSNWIRSLGTDGIFTASQPACSDVSDAGVFCSSTDAAGLTGTVASARLSGSYTGITGLGTVTVGVWTATKVGLAYGGTNADLTATGGTSQVLKQVSAGAAVTVGQLACADLSNGSASCSTDATNASNISSGTLPSGRLTGSYTGITGTGTLTAGATGAGFTVALGTSTITGQLGVANGGTGAATLTANSVLLGNGTSAVAFATIGTAGRVLIDQGAAANPSFNAVSGDATLAAAGALTIAANAVTYAKFQQVAASSLVGNATGVLANATGITLGSTLSFSGSTLICTTGTAAQLGCVSPDNVTITATAGVLTAIGGAATSVAIGTTTISGGTTTRILYDNAGVLGEYTLTGSGTVAVMQTSPSLITPALGVATATSVAVGGCTIGSDVLCAGTGSSTFTGTLTVSAAPFVTSGNRSAAAWTTAGVRIKLGAASYTDTSSSGTVATAYTDVHGAGTILASSATTYTNYFGAYFVDPVASTNVTMTNKWALGADSAKFGTSNQATITNAGLLTVPGTLNVSGTFQIAGNAMTFPAAAATIPRTVASGAKALATGAIGSAACTTAQTDTATGTLTTDAISISFNADVTAVTGYASATTGGLAIYPYPTADTVNFKVCNPTTASITPGAVTLNWRVIR